MSTKEIALGTIRDLPEDVSWRQIEERIRFLVAIEQAREEVKNGSITPHGEVRDLLETWLSE